MKISVIIPVKNRASLIGQTIENLLAQSLKPYEIIVVNDHSTDDLMEVLKPFGKSILVTTSSGNGPGAARNTGLSLSTGDAIQFFDSDDLMTLNKLETQADILESNEIDFVYGPYVKAEEYQGQWQQKGPIMQYYALPQKPLSNLVIEGWCLLTQSVLFRKSFLDTVTNWRTDLMPHEDWEYWFRIALKRPRYKFENKSCVIYRQHRNQITDLEVRSKARRLDGINAGNIIAKAIPSEISAVSKLVFDGRQGNMISQLNSEVGPSEQLALTYRQKVAIFYFKIWTRIERFRSGTEWMRFHGANSSSQIFNDYIKRIN